jgi:hypothetical protein
MTLRRWTLLVILASLSAGGTATASNRYDPRLRFRTISTAHFDIHFHQGEDLPARRLAQIAEEVASLLEPRLGRPSGRVNVVLVNQSDLPNGWATPVPFNLIEITAAAPGGESMIGNTNDWLRLVFTHEYTHIVHLSRSRGWIGGLRHVFGRMPLLMPNLFTPLWQIEGIATYEETAVTGSGRIHAGDFRIIGERAASTGGFLALDQASGGLIDWPSGQAPYVYGGLFHDYLAAKYGGDSLRRLADSSAGHVPYFGFLGFRKTFGKSLGDLWQEFEAESRVKSSAAGDSTIARRLTHHGFSVMGPRFGPEGRVYYSVANPDGFPALMTVGIGDAAPRRITDKYLGSRVAFAGRDLVFDQVELVQQVGLQSDLYAMPAEGGSIRRLTREARAADPDVSPDGHTIVCTVQRADGRGLATMDLLAAGTLGTLMPLNADPLTDWSSPRWSPDGRSIAAERRTLGGQSEIVVVDTGSGAVRVLASFANERSISPAWTADGRAIVFARSNPRRGFEIHSVSIESGAVSMLRDTGPSAHSPAIDREGAIAFVGYTNDGDDLFVIPAGAVQWTPVTPETALTSSSVADPPPVGSKPYAPWPTLVPRFWTPTVETDADELVIGAATGGYDALGRHVYGIEAGWSTARSRPDWQIAYAYDRWWPTLFADVSDDTDPFRDGDVRTLEANVGLLLPIRRVRWSQSWLGSLHASRDRLTCSTCGPDGVVEATRVAVRSGWLIDAARSYGYSIGEEDGWSSALTTEFTRDALGSDGDGGAATLDLRGYLPLGSRHVVLAARAAGATTWGDEAVRRVVSAAGSGPQSLGFNFGTDAIGLLRGVDEGDVAGEHAAVVNVDLRVPFWRIERGLGTVPFFARTLHGSLFADVSHAWTGAFRRRDVSRSFGAELSVDAVVGFVLPLTFTGGVAWREVPGVDRGVAVFGRVGRAF